jgi:plasmid stabilization system protein ParE
MKPLKIIWTPQSQDDLRKIRDFIARDAPITAEAFIRRLKMAVGGCEDSPNLALLSRKARIRKSAKSVPSKPTS